MPNDQMGTRRASHNEVHDITSLAPTLAAILELPAPESAQNGALPEVVLEMDGVARVAVLVTDALGLSVWQRWRAEMPFLTSLHTRRHLILRSVLPPITPVNFATMVTGAVPEAHAVADKADTIACESLFDVVRAAGGRSAGVGRPGYTGGEFLARHADLSGRTAESSDDAVVEKVIALAREESPIFLIAQLGEPDTVFHRIGVSAPEIAPVLRATDQHLSRLTGELLPLGYAVMILADHGQHDVRNPETGETRGTHDGSKPNEDLLVPFTWHP